MAIFLLGLIPFLLLLASIPFGLHKVDEGHVGVYWRGGAILPGITEPGYHMRLPLVTDFVNVQVTMQTDRVENIPCGTSGGVMIYFDKVEVVNRLKKDHVFETVKNYTVNYDKLWLFDRVHHELNQWCSTHTLQEVYITMFDQLDESLQVALQSTLDEWAPGIEIITIRVTKPRVPERILQAYENMEKQRTQLTLAARKQDLVVKEAETVSKSALIEAQKKLEVKKIETQKLIAEQKALQEIESVKNAMHVEQMKAKTDAYFYTQRQEAEANKALLTEDFMKLQYAENVVHNSQLVIGSDIPDTLAFGSSDVTNVLKKKG